jgi:hypothetical protein
MHMVGIFRDPSHLLASDHGRLPIMVAASGMLQKIKNFGTRGNARDTWAKRAFIPLANEIIRRYNRFA